MDFDPTDASPEELESNGYPKDYNEMTAPQQEAFQRQLNGGVWDHLAPGFERLTNPEYVADVQPDFEAADEHLQTLRETEPVAPPVSPTPEQISTPSPAVSTAPTGNPSFGAPAAPAAPAAPEQPTLI